MFGFGHQQRLWKRMKKGDPKALDEMLQLYYAPIYAYLRRLSHCPEGAKDLTQETFIRVLKALPSQDSSDSFKAWIYRIARNVWLNSRRTKDPIVAQSDEWWANQPSPARPHPLEIADRELALHLWQAVERLDMEKRDTIYLHYYQGLSLRETAQVLSIATATVKYRLREAIKSLRRDLQCVQPYCENTIILTDREALNHDH